MPSKNSGKGSGSVVPSMAHGRQIDASDGRARILRFPSANEITETHTLMSAHRRAVDPLSAKIARIQQERPLTYAVIARLVELTALDSDEAS